MTYEYVCTSCNHEWEASQSIKDAPLKDCPQCHAQTAKRQVSGGTGFVLKGGGWYADLYSSSKPSSDSAKSDGESKTTTSETKTETKTVSDSSSATPSKTSSAAD